MKLLAFTLLILAASVRSQTKQPNFVVLMADDLGYGDVFGNETLPTPNIDSIATRGAKLTHHLAAASVCTPSRAAFLTGRYPVRYGMESHSRNKVILFVASSGGLPQSEITFPKLLQKNGYATALIGKWHLGNDALYKGDKEHHPLKHGFDHFYGLPLTNLKDFGEEGTSVVTTYLPHFFRILAGIIIVGLTLAFMAKSLKWSFLSLLFFCIVPVLIALFVCNIPKINGILMRGDVVIEQPIHLPGLTQRLVKESKSFLGEMASSQKPFLLVLNFVHVHTALFSAPVFKGKSLHHGEYGDNVLELDWAVGEILQTLDALGLMNNTLVYFSSDNGAHIEEVGPKGDRHGGHNGPLRGGKGMGGFEGGIRVPTAAMWPGHIPPKLEINAPTSQMDFFPTVLQLASIATPKDRVIDGKDIHSLLFGLQATSPHQMLFHYCGVKVHALTHLQPDGSIIKVHFATPKWMPGKEQCEYICHCMDNFVNWHKPPLVYNLTSDLSERSPLPQDVKFHRVVGQAYRVLKEHQTSLSSSQPPTSQFSLYNSMWKPWLQPCCNFPFCQCSEERYPV